MAAFSDLGVQQSLTGGDKSCVQLIFGLGATAAAAAMPQSGGGIFLGFRVFFSWQNYLIWIGHPKSQIPDLGTGCSGGGRGGTVRGVHANQSSSTSRVVLRSRPTFVVIWQIPSAALYFHCWFPLKSIFIFVFWRSFNNMKFAWKGTFEAWMVKFGGEIGTLYQIFTPCTPLPKYKRAFTWFLGGSNSLPGCRRIFYRGLP